MYYFFNGRYACREMPGAGGKGAVTVKATVKADGTAAAIKIWNRDAAEGRNEAEIWKNAFPDLYLESRTEGKRFVLARRWIEGESLADHAEKKGILDEREALAVCLGTALRLKQFYELTGMYFGDLRPENVIIGGGTVALVDFESAGKEPRGAEERCASKAGTLRFATPSFAAPEVFRGEPCCASDFYSLGLILRFLLTGSCGKSGILPEDSPRARFISRCTASDPGERYSCIEEVAGELGAMLRNSGGKPLGTLEEEVLFALGEDLPYVKNTDPEQDTCFDENAETKQDPNCVKTAADEPGPPEDSDGKTKNTVLEDGSENRLEDNSDNKGADANEPLLFPHFEKGYRRLILYVPGNISFAAELAYAAGACFGFKACVYELCDYAPPRVFYYLTPSRSAGGAEAEKDAAAGGRVLFERAEESIDAGYDIGGASLASESGPVYAGTVKTVDITEAADRSREYVTRRMMPWLDCGIEDGMLRTAVTEECEKVSAGAEVLDGGFEADDCFMRAFMCGAYSLFDVTVLCDNMTGRVGDSIQFMRFSDYTVVPVRADADEIEAENARYTRLLSDNMIPAGRLRIVSWEQDDACAEIRFDGDEGQRRFLGSIRADRTRRYIKNVQGGIYCRTMDAGILREYCRILSALVFGDEENKAG